MAERRKSFAGMRKGDESSEPKKQTTEAKPQAEQEPLVQGEILSKGGTKFRPMQTERIKALLKSMQEDVRFINAIIVMMGCFFSLYVFRFYPFLAIPFILIAVGAVAFRSAPFGTIVATAIAFPAVAYQSPLFAWLFMAILAAVMFKAFETWKLISLLFVLVCSPFTPFGFLIILFHVISGLLLGSRRGAIVTVMTVFTVLLLSALWGVENEGFMVFNYNYFASTIYPMNPDAFSYLKLSRPEPSAYDFLSGRAFSDAFSGLLDWSVAKHLNDAIGITLLSSAVLLFNDSALIQIVLWTVAVFIIGFIPGRVKWRNKNVIASSASFLILLAIVIATFISHVPFNFLSIPAVLISIGFVWVLERAGIDLSREIVVMKQERMKKFSKFGLQDLSLARGVESLKDIGGYESTKKELYEAVVVPMQRRELQTAYGLTPPKGLLLFGPPGTGKTLLMRALAKEMDIGFYYVKCSDLLSQWYGETEQNIAELFRIARENAPCVLFFDEIDSIGKRRDKYTADDVAPRLLSVLLAELDGLKTDKTVILVGATNVPHELDPALLRPGRFDKLIYMPLPDKESRKQIFKVHTRNLPLSDDVDFDELARKTERYSGADIANVVREAARRASRFGIEADRVVPITMNDFLFVLEQLKPSVSISQLEEYERFKIEFERRVEPEKKEKKEKAVTWKDVVGLDDVREVLLEAIELPLLHEDLLKEYHVEPIKGILLFGPPGCGKTMIVKAAANELNATFLSLSGADLLKLGYDGAVTEIKNTFNRAKENPPAIIFIDEVDAIAPSREIASATPLGEKLVAQLLNEMDGVKQLKNVLFIGATNRPEILDSAMLRPGRFDKIIFIHPPLAEGRAHLFELNLKGVPKADDVDFARLAKYTDGYTGADIASICQEAKMRLIRGRLAGKHNELHMSDLLDIISERRPSVTPQMLEHYMRFLREYGERR